MECLSQSFRERSAKKWKFFTAFERGASRAVTSSFIFLGEYSPPSLACSSEALCVQATWSQFWVIACNEGSPLHSPLHKIVSHHKGNVF